MTNELLSYLQVMDEYIFVGDYVSLIDKAPFQLSFELLSVLTDAGLFHELYPTIVQNLKEYTDIVTSTASNIGLPVMLDVDQRLQNEEKFNKIVHLTYPVTYIIGKTGTYHLRDCYIDKKHYIYIHGAGAPLSISSIPELPFHCGILITELIATDTQAKIDKYKTTLAEIFQKVKDKLDQVGLNYDK